MYTISIISQINVHPVDGKVRQAVMVFELGVTLRNKLYLSLRSLLMRSGDVKILQPVATTNETQKCILMCKPWLG